ncbi:MAG TPA: hypothetical protein VGG04_02805 [Candidatus Sulfotelmatobacter sp.]|jgi:hypothetical protein
MSLLKRKKKRLPLTTLQGIFLAIALAALFAAAFALVSHLNLGLLQ